MTTTTKVLAGAGVGLLAYYFYKHKQAAGQIQVLAAATTPVIADPGYVASPIFSPPNSALPVAAAPPLPPTLSPAASSAADPSKLAALVNWANINSSLVNAPLFLQFFDQLDPADVSTFYDILEQQWLTGAQPTTAHTNFWNAMRNTYPFLNTDGNGCKNFFCN